MTSIKRAVSFIGGAMTSVEETVTFVGERGLAIGRSFKTAKVGVDNVKGVNKYNLRR